MLKIFKKENIKGFTLIELLISVSIITIIMSVVLFNYSKFNSDLSLTTSAQYLAIAIREAQINALAVKETYQGNGRFDDPYGVFFDPTKAGYYYIFVDKNGNDAYDSGVGCFDVGGTECIERVDLKTDVTLYQICSGNTCYPNPPRTLAVLFRRPDPEAKILFFDNGVQSGSAQQRGQIVLKSASGKTIKVIVESTGYVLIQ
ncbi:MAG: type II secretion system protein [Nitrospira sp.]